MSAPAKPDHFKTPAEIERERDQLRAELERVREALNAEIDRSERHMDEAHELRAALETIRRAHSNSWISGSLRGTTLSLLEFIDAALARDGEGQP